MANRPSSKRGRRRSRETSRRSSRPQTPRPPRAKNTPARQATLAALDAWEEQAAKLRQSPNPAPTDTSVLELDSWQKEAFEHLQSGCNVVVDAPTTAGKTRVVESFFQSNLGRPEFRAAYTTPVKSLSNDKLREFRAMFGRDKVGIATGDVKENLQAPIVVTTLETYRNSLLGVDPDLSRNLVVFDEYHFMQDGSRGSAWEEAIILTPDDCQLLMMSASVDNGREFVAWLEKIHGRTSHLVSTRHRPVPLTNIVYFQGEWLLAESLPKSALRSSKPGSSKPGSSQWKQGNEPLPLPHKHLAPRLVQLLDLGLTPCIIYAGRRKSVESITFELGKTLEPLPISWRQEIEALLKEEDEETKALRFIDHKLRRLLVSYGVGFHHSGMAPPARLAVERILKRGKLRFCAATMGLSIGINFSVRSTLISDFQRPGEGGFARYAPSEVLQMLGRAGRRGRDVVGYSLWASPESYTHLAKAKRDRCDSRLRNDPTTYLGLVSRDYSPRNIELFYARSFMRFNDTGVDLGLVRKQRVIKKLGAKELPCASPAHEFAKQYVDQQQPRCNTCQWQEPCHRYIQAKADNDLAALHIHLHVVGALTDDERLTPYGEIAKYFPQSGGLLVARYVLDHLQQADLLDCAELMGTVSLAGFKQPNIDDNFRSRFDTEELEQALCEYYPIELFPELYDQPFGNRSYPMIRELNPSAGLIVRLWLEGLSWKELEQQVTNPKFAQGDLISLIYRVASYMQSLAQAKAGEISRYAGSVRDELLREPLTVTV